jgi:hypothetical protein
VRELEELMSRIEQGGVTISGLQGLGGISKTALALKLGRRITRAIAYNRPRNRRRAKAIAHVEASLEILEQIESPYAEWARVKLAQWREEA